MSSPEQVFGMDGPTFRGFRPRDFWVLRLALPHRWTAMVFRLSEAVLLQEGSRLPAEWSHRSWLLVVMFHPIAGGCSGPRGQVDGGGLPSFASMRVRRCHAVPPIHSVAVQLLRLHINTSLGDRGIGNIEGARIPLRLEAAFRSGTVGSFLEASAFARAQCNARLPQARALAERR